MSVSSVSSAPPAAAVKPIEAKLPDVKSPEVKRNDDAKDSRNDPPPQRAALPPGQGTRIDQLA